MKPKSPWGLRLFAEEYFQCLSLPGLGRSSRQAKSGALAALKQHHCLPHSLLLRHLSGDWGQVALEDAARNDQALVNDERLLASYEIAAGVVVWVITERDRSVITLLLPVEY